MSLAGVLICILAFVLGRFIRTKTAKEIKDYEKFMQAGVWVILLCLLFAFVFYSVQETSIKILLFLLLGGTFTFIFSYFRRSVYVSFLNYSFIAMGVWITQFSSESLRGTSLIFCAMYLLVKGSLTGNDFTRKIMVMALSAAVASILFVIITPTVGGSYVTAAFCFGGVAGSELSKRDFRSKSKNRGKKTKSNKN